MPTGSKSAHSLSDVTASYSEHVSRLSRRLLPVITLVLLSAALSACGQLNSNSSSSTATSDQATSPRHTHHRQKAHRPPAHRQARRQRPSQRSQPGRLVASGVSAAAVQPQLPPGSCRARGSGVYSLPDSACTPGAVNPVVTQATISQTICVSGFTRTIRPSESVTHTEKLGNMAAYGDGRSTGDYEYDHLVSLELGGAVNDPRNLWPEPGGSPNPKDTIENALHRMVCDGRIQLADAQRIIATNWVSWAKTHRHDATSWPTARTEPQPHTPTQTPAPSMGGPAKPISEINCSDFTTHATAQQWFERHGGSKSNDVARLDGNRDGVACSSLP